MANELKYGIALVIVLALSAAALSVLLTTAHTVQAQAAGGAIYGTVLWVDMYGNANTMAWAQVTADNGMDPAVITYTTDGQFGMWLPAGTYDVTASSSPGFHPHTIAGVVVSSGSSTGLEFTLQPTGEPIPEVPPWAAPLLLVSAILITAVSVRRYRTKPRS